MALQTTKIFSHQFTSQLWRMEIDELNDVLFAEIRDTADKQVSFSAIDLKTSEIYFKDLNTDERWLTGMEAAYNGVLLLHHYQSESSPVHKGIVAIDAKTGATLWRNYNYSFDHLTSAGPIAFDHRIQPRKLFLADHRTGATIAADELSLNQQVESSIILPELISANTVNLPVAAQGNIAHFADYNKVRIVSLHALNNGQLQQLLFIIDNGAVVFEDLLNDAIQKMQPESFILYKNYLIYLVNRCQIKVLTL